MVEILLEITNSDNNHSDNSTNDNKQQKLKKL